jgi:hypothetical protein
LPVKFALNCDCVVPNDARIWIGVTHFGWKEILLMMTLRKKKFSENKLGLNNFRDLVGILIIITLVIFLSLYHNCLKQGLPTWGTRPPGGTWWVGKGDASFSGLIEKIDFLNVFMGIFLDFADLNKNWANYRWAQLAQLKFFLTYNPSTCKGHLTGLTYTWGDAGLIIFYLGGQWRDKVGNPWFKATHIL